MKIALGVIQGIFKGGASAIRIVLTQPLVLFILLVAAIAGGGYSYFQYQQTQQELKRLIQNPRAISVEETKRLISKVGEIADLPKGEDPVVATVTDRDRLKDQPFFAKAQNGDKVLIYTQGRRAILYRPSTNKIIDVAPVNIGTGSAITGSKVQTIKVALYNGTTTTGFTNTVEKQVEESVNNTEVVLKENAARNDYTKSLVVDLSGNRTDLANQLAKVLNGAVGGLPDGENKPDADILVILGEEKPSETPTPTPTQE